MKKLSTIKEAKRLHDLGFAILWLHSKSKRPKGGNWTSGPRKPWKVLKREYQDGDNVGVRLGTPSKIGDRYLCVIDIDIKSDQQKHLDEAREALRQLVTDDLPAVSSGRGGGSGHIYCLTGKPFKTFNAAESKDIVKVHMPSKSPSKKELETLTKKELEAGTRLSRAWEISLYSDGRQVVLPPSIHPDTGKSYRWTTPLKTVEDFKDSFSFKMPAEKDKGGERESSSVCGGGKTPTRTPFKFTVQDIDPEFLTVNDQMLGAILNGENVTDRSAFLMPATQALISAGYTLDEVLSILTNEETFLGECAYEHAKTKKRERAAYWLWKYTVGRIWESRQARAVFEGVVVEEPAQLEGDAVDKQRRALGVVKRDQRDWTDYLERGGQGEGGRIKNTLQNATLVLDNALTHGALRYNEFGQREEVYSDIPWVSAYPHELNDVDLKRLVLWFASKWGYEPSEDKLRSAVAVVASKNSFHPVRAWLEELPAWDGVKRCERFLETYIPCSGAPFEQDELRRVVGRRFLVNLVKRIYEPGCQSDYVLILEGGQGIYKSSAFRALVGDDWFTDATFNPEDKDAVMVLASKWLIEFGELSNLDRTTAEHMKAFITRRTDRIRAPFDRKARDYPRQCVFVGSTNKDEYLKDETGNRRYWPFRVRAACDVEAIRRDRLQLFAEALHLYRNGEPTWLAEGHLEREMLTQQDHREMHDVLIEQVAHAIESIEAMYNKKLDGFLIRELFEGTRMQGVKNDKYGTARVGTCLRRLGYVQRQERRGRGVKGRFWYLPEELKKTPISINEIEDF